jgi:hypothetical protein
MIISPPSDLPDVYTPPPPSTDLEKEYARIREYMDVKPWKCACRLVNFGRNKYCADYKCRNPRPTDFVEVSR